MSARFSRRVVFVVLIAAAGVTGWVGPNPSPAPREPARVVADAPPPAPTAAFVAMAPPVFPSSAPLDPHKPVIDTIELEKTSVCAGEENLVRVRAHASDGDG